MISFTVAANKEATEPRLGFIMIRLERNIECSPLLIINVNKLELSPLDQRQITLHTSMYHCCGSFYK